MTTPYEANRLCPVCVGAVRVRVAVYSPTDIEYLCLTCGSTWSAGQPITSAHPPAHNPGDAPWNQDPFDAHDY